MPFKKKTRRGLHFKKKIDSAVESTNYNNEDVNNTSFQEDYLPFSRNQNNSVDYDDLPELEIERIRLPGQFDPCIRKINGRRIVDIQHFITAIRRLESHDCRISKTGYFAFEKEHVSGLNSNLIFKCPSCKMTTSVKINPRDQSQECLEHIMTSTAISNGKGFSFIEELLANLAVPGFSTNTYSKYQQRVGEEWYNALTLSIEAAGKEEYGHAKETENMIGTIGRIEVIVDGGWSHRSYGHRYSAKSGVAAIIGVFSKKILFIGIRNKYCSICAIASKKNIQTPKHTCFANWSGSSSAMEADIIREGFCSSELMHNLQYTTFTGDGDSSVHSTILELVPYSRVVKKVECANHLLKNLKKHLYALAAENTAMKRLLPSSRINLLTKLCRRAISHHASGDNSVINLQTDLKNIPMHVFGDHTNCESYYCMTTGQKATLKIYEDCRSQIKLRIKQIIDRLVIHAESLIRNCTSNRAEMLMHLVAKCNGGKQHFYGRRNGFNIRCWGAALSYQHGPAWMLKCTKRKIPNQRLKRLVQSRIARNERSRTRSKSTTYNEKFAKADSKHYGERCVKPDVPNEVVQELIKEQINALEVSSEKQAAVEEITRGQSDNAAWFEERRCRLTASNFGVICTRRTKFGKLVYDLLYRNLPGLPQLEYGKINEGVARIDYESLTGLHVRECGLIVCKMRGLGFLAASPDGLVGDNKLIEIKCPYSAQKLTPKEAAGTIKTFCSKLVGNSLELRKSHKYYYQIQGLLFITERKECDFVIWTPKGIEVQTIGRDDTFIEKMVKKLKSFYVNYYAFELVDSRHERNMKLRFMDEE